MHRNTHQLSRRLAATLRGIKRAVLNNPAFFSMLGVATLCIPALAAAQDFEVFEPVQDDTSRGLMLIAAFVILSIVLTRIWMGVMNVSLLKSGKHEKSQDEVYVPSVQTIVITTACTAALFILSIKTLGGIAPFDGPSGVTRGIIFFVVAALLAIVSQFFWPRARHYVFASTIGTLVTFILLGFHRMLFTPGVSQDPFFMALGVVCVVLAWRFLFGPWRPIVKATVLGTFIFWVAVHLLLNEAPEERTARLLAAIVALIPAVIWCMLFLRDHVQRRSLVVLMFFAGMISTAPILFYDAMVRHRVELQFFLFRIVPENFTRSSNVFVSGNLAGVTGLKSTLVATLVSFLIVGLIEEASKFWVLKKSGDRFFSSIDDVLQLSIIVAIGFAFAENVINPTYFLSFVREYLIRPESPMWGAFIGNVMGRAILTNMVHILSTGVLGYFYGMKVFAGPYLRDDKKDGDTHPIIAFVHRVLRLPEKSLFRREVMATGFVTAVFLHGLFNFLVTLPDLLPGHPRTIGDLIGSSPGSPFHYVALLIVPSLFYVVGGFWVLSILFYKKECMKERGCLVQTDTFVKPEVVIG